MSLTYCRQCGNMMLPGSNQTDPEWLDCDNFDCVLSGVAQFGTSVDNAPNALQKQLDGALERIAELERRSIGEQPV